MTLEELLNSYDWQQAFYFSKDIAIEDVSEIIASSDGHNDGDAWIGIFKLKDGKLLYLNAGCDYTGWECQSGGYSVVKDSILEVLMSCTGDDERQRLQDQFTYCLKHVECMEDPKIGSVCIAKTK